MFAARRFHSPPSLRLSHRRYLPLRTRQCSHMGLSMFSNTPSASQCPHLPVYWNGARVGAWHVAPRMRHPCHFGLTIESQPTALLPTVGHSALKSSSHCGAHGQDKPHFAAISFKTPSYFSTESATPKSYTKMIEGQALSANFRNATLSLGPDARTRPLH